MIHVAEILKGLEPGGAERALIERLRNSASPGFRYTLINVREQQDALASLTQHSGIRVISTASSSPLSLWRLLRDEEVDIVNVHAPSIALELKALRLLHPPWSLIETIHNIRYRSRVVSTLSTLTANMVDTNVAVSNTIRQSSLLRRSNKSEMVRLGVETAEIRRQARAAALKWRTHLALEPDACLVSIVAGFRPEKNHILLLEAISQIVPTLRAKSVHFILAGDGPAFSGFKEALGRTDFQDIVHLVGRVTNGWEVTAASDISLLTSTYEGVPLSLMEALACGVPIIAPKVGGVPELVNPAVGLLYPPGDARALALQLEHLVEDDRFRRDLANGAVSHSSNWDVRTSVAHFEDLYQSMPSSRKARRVVAKRRRA